MLLLLPFLHAARVARICIAHIRHRDVKCDAIACVFCLQAVSTSTPCGDASCSRLDSPEQVSHGSFVAFSACCTRCTFLFRTIPPSWRQMRRDRVVV